MKKDALKQYIKAFSVLRTDRTGRWTSVTNSQAPHKPFLLLSILDLFAQGLIQTNFIELTPDLGDLFAAYWSEIMPPERRGNIVLPFFHLRSSGFWHLIPQPGQEQILQSLKQVDTLNQLKKVTLGAKVDEDLFKLLQTDEARNILRAVLMETYFSPEAQDTLMRQITLNTQSFVYSQKLIEEARREIRKSLAATGEIMPQVRDQGFRKAIVRIYEHRWIVQGFFCKLDHMFLCEVVW